MNNISTLKKVMKIIKIIDIWMEKIMNKVMNALYSLSVNIGTI